MIKLLKIHHKYLSNVITYISISFVSLVTLIIILSIGIRFRNLQYYFFQGTIRVYCREAVYNFLDYLISPIVFLLWINSFIKDNNRYQLVIKDIGKIKIKFICSKVLYLFILTFIIYLFIYFLFSFYFLIDKNFFNSNDFIFDIFTNSFLLTIYYSIISILFTIITKSILTFIFTNGLLVVSKIILSGSKSNTNSFFSFLFPTILQNKNYELPFGSVHLILLTLLVFEIFVVMYLTISNC